MKISFFTLSFKIWLFRPFKDNVFTAVTTFVALELAAHMKVPHVLTRKILIINSINLKQWGLNNEVIVSQSKVCLLPPKKREWRNCSIGQ